MKRALLVLFLLVTFCLPFLLEKAEAVSIGARSQIGATKPRVASATVLVIDVSGSMGHLWQGGIKIESAKQAAIDVINMIGQESEISGGAHQLAVVSFSTEAYLNQGLTDDCEAAIQAVRALQPMDRTNIGAGLQMANQALLSAPKEAKKIIVLLSDGMTNEGLLPEEILAGPVREAREAGTCIYTVGFGDPGDIDEDLLRKIAAGAACGEYHYAGAPAELERVYIRLHHKSMGTILAEFEGQIAHGEKVRVGQVEVPPHKGELHITLHWPGSDLDLIVTDPWGRRVDKNYPGVSVKEYERLIYMIIQNPLPGPWVLHAFGAEVSEKILNYYAIVSVRERVMTASSPALLFTGVVMLTILLVAALVAILVITQQRSIPGTAPAGVQVLTGRTRRRFVPLRRGQLIIGRHPRCNLVLNDPLVSSHHAIIQYTPQGYLLTDLNSESGTFVNGQPIKQVILRGGERLQIGGAELLFVAASMPAVPYIRAYLSVMAGNQEFARYTVAPGTILGRYPGCPVDLRSDALVSLRHARLDYRDGQWIITDLGSKNGTYVNGQRVHQRILTPGDVIQIGNTRMRFYTA